MVGADTWQAGGNPAELSKLDAKVLITGRLARRESLVVREFDYAKGRAARPLKVTLPSPSSIAARFHPVDRLAISPQCGFASAMQGNPLPVAAQRAKLELVGEIGRALAS